MATVKLVDFDHVTDYISREAALACFHDWIDRYGHEHSADEMTEYQKIEELPAADVVARDCYDRILAENDTMREMLAGIGKKPGDKMDDVRPVVRGKWRKFLDRDCYPFEDGNYTYQCSQCNAKFGYDWDFCPHCGADMREPNLDTTKGERRDESIG